jgi:hypothetical protein
MGRQNAISSARDMRTGNDEGEIPMFGKHESGNSRVDRDNYVEYRLRKDSALDDVFVS